MTCNRILLIIFACSWPLASQAWDPYPNHSNPPPQERVVAPARLARPISYSVTPAPAYTPPAPAVTYYAPPASAPAPVAYAPPPPPPVTYTAPAVQPAPVYTPPATAYVPAALPAPISDVPAYAPAPVAEPYVMASAPYVEPNTAPSEHWWKFGIEGFYDEYREDSIDVKTKSNYFGFSMGYEYTAHGNTGLYAAYDGRMGFGETDYKSPSGKIDGIEEKDYEGAVKLGYSFLQPSGLGITPYSGFGARFFDQSLGGEQTNLGAVGYDRRILQFYLPVGVNLRSVWNGWNVSSNLEYDHLLYGVVMSKLSQVGFEDASNRQYDGFGLRGDIMFGETLENGARYEFGPYVRYWDIGDSELDSQTAGTVLEPENTRLQLGASLKYMF